MMCKESWHSPSYNTAYTLWTIALALLDIAPFGRNVIYAENVMRNSKTYLSRKGDRKFHDVVAFV